MEVDSEMRDSSTSGAEKETQAVKMDSEELSSREKVQKQSCNPD